MASSSHRRRCVGVAESAASSCASSASFQSAVQLSSAISPPRDLGEFLDVVEILRTSTLLLHPDQVLDRGYMHFMIVDEDRSRASPEFVERKRFASKDIDNQ